MLTQTTITATRLLIFLGDQTDGQVVVLKQIAQSLGESPTYLVKVARHLVRAGLLRAQRGKTGGVLLNRSPKGITLLAIVEACQGTIHGDFCQDVIDISRTCAFHQAGAELHHAISTVLTRWTLADFIGKPCPAGNMRNSVDCLLQGGRPGVLLPAKRGRR